MEKAQLQQFGNIPKEAQKYVAIPVMRNPEQETRLNISYDIMFRK